MKGLNLSSGIVTIDNDDYDPAYAQDGQPSPYITLEKAQEIALTQANVNAADAVFDDKEFDHDDGPLSSNWSLLQTGTNTNMTFTQLPEK